MVLKKSAHGNLKNLQKFKNYPSLLVCTHIHWNLFLTKRSPAPTWTNICVFIAIVFSISCYYWLSNHITNQVDYFWRQSNQERKKCCRSMKASKLVFYEYQSIKSAVAAKNGLDQAFSNGGLWAKSGPQTILAWPFVNSNIHRNT